MSGQLQPKTLSELAISSFRACMEMKVRELIKICHQAVENDVPFTELLVTITRICADLKHFFHETRLPSHLANELTERLLITFNKILNWENPLIVIGLVEICIHPDVTEIQLGSRSLHGFDAGDIPFPEIGLAIVNKIRNLRNLKKMNLRFYFYKVPDEIVIPSKITEFTLYSTGRHIRDPKFSVVVDCCPQLKTLKLRSCAISPQSILKCKHLETLHLINTTFKDEDFAYLINEMDTATSPLRSLGLTLKEEKTLRMIVDKLPNLTEIILDFYRDEGLSCLTKLKNLRSLSLIPMPNITDGYKAFLPSLGEKLVSLCLSNNCLDLEFIGETCTNLKSLHLFGECRQGTQPSLKSFSNFKSVETLEVELSSDPYWTDFIVNQCINVKELCVVSEDKSLYSIVTMVIDRTPLNNLRTIHWWTTEKLTDRNLMEEYRSKYPNVLIVHEHTHFEPEIVVFYSLGSRHEFFTILPLYIP